MTLYKNKYYTIGLSLLMVLVLHSCKLQKEYQAPAIEVPDTFRGQDSLHVATDSLDMAEIQWKAYFEDPYLIALIEQGLQYNFDIQKALKNIEINNLRAGQANMEWLPSVSATLGNVNYQYRSKDFYSTASSKYYNTQGKEAPENMYWYTMQNASSLNVSWEIDIWGKIKNQRDEVLAGYLQTKEAQKTIQTEIISKIAEGYYNLLLLNAQLEVAQSNYELTQNTLKIVDLQYQAGNTTALATQQTKSQMLVAKALIPNLKQQIGVQENALRLLVGQFPDEVKFGNAMLSTLVPKDTLTIGVPLELVRHRPDVVAAELELDAKNAVVGVTQAKRYPSLEINLSGGVNSMLPENWFNIPGALFGSVIGGLTQPVFSKKRLKTDFEVAKIEREQAEIDLQKTVYTAITEVSDALIVIKNVEEQLAIAEDQVQTTNLAIKQSNLLFNSGYATYLEVITTQKAALENELNLNRIKHAKLLSRVKLYKSLGGGWQ